MKFDIPNTRPVLSVIHILNNGKDGTRADKEVRHVSNI